MRRRSGRAVAARLVAALAAASTAAAVLGACGSTRRAAPAPAPSPSSAPATSLARPASGFTEVGAPQLAIGGGPTTTLAGVLAPTAQQAPWVVVGTRQAGDGTSAATVWTSPDTTTWTPASLTGSGVTSEAAAITSYAGGTLVVGSIGSGATRRAAVWRSPGPGQAFTQLPDQAAFSAAGGARMDLVAAGALGVFAVGTADGAPAVWYSTDGRRFTRDAGAERVIGAAADPHLRALVVDGDGVFAAGSVGAGPAMAGAVFTSTDGIDWAEEPEVDGVFRGASAHEITGMVAVDRFPGRLFVAVGAVDEGGGWVPASWLSPDGHSWSTPSLAFPDPGPTAPGSGVAAGASLDPGGVTATAVAATTDGFVAVGGAGRGAAGLVWTSSDGRSWVPAALPGPAATAPWQPAVVAAAGSTTVVADRQPGDAHLLVDDPGGWREPTADAATWGTPAPVATPVGLGTDAAGATLVVDVRTPGQTLGPVTHSTVVLTSPDATAWQVVAAPAFGAATVAATSPALRTAVGSEPGAGGTPVAAVFTSPDGQQWQPSPAAPGAFGGTGVAERATAALELAAGGPLVVGTGAAPGSTSGGAPLAWTATHGSFGAPVDLEGADSLAVATPTGACQAASGIVAAVGVASRDDAVAPRAWVTTGAGATSSWRPTTVAAPTGGAAAVEGCSLIGGHLVAWGTLATATGGTQPALWDSSDAASWASRRVDAFDQAGREGGAPGLVALAASGDDWLAAGGAAPAPATGAGGATGLWRSADGGRTFTRVATSAAPFTATGRESLDVVGWLGSTGIVAGDVDGRLAVWTVTGD